MKNLNKTQMTNVPNTQNILGNTNKEFKPININLFNCKQNNNTGNNIRNNDSNFNLMKKQPS